MLDSDIFIACHVSALSPRNYIAVIFNCFPRYVVLTNAVAGWVLFGGNIFLSEWNSRFIKDSGVSVEVGEVDDGLSSV